MINILLSSYDQSYIDYQIKPLEKLLSIKINSKEPCDFILTLRTGTIFTSDSLIQAINENKEIVRGYCKTPSFNSITDLCYFENNLSIKLPFFKSDFVLYKSADLVYQIKGGYVNKLVKYEVSNIQKITPLIHLNLKPSVHKVQRNVMLKYNRSLYEWEYDVNIEQVQSLFQFVKDFFNFYKVNDFENYYKENFASLKSLTQNDLFKKLKNDNKVEITYTVSEFENNHNYPKIIITLSFVTSKHWGVCNKDYKVFYTDNFSKALKLLYENGGFLVSPNLQCTKPIKYWRFLEEVNNVFLRTDMDSYLLIAKPRNISISKLIKGVEISEYKEISKSDLNNISIISGK